MQHFGLSVGLKSLLSRPGFETEQYNAKFNTNLYSVDDWRISPNLIRFRSLNSKKNAW